MGLRHTGIVAALCASLLSCCSGERHVTVGRAHACHITSSDNGYTAFCSGGSDGWTSWTLGPFHGISAGNGFTCGLFMNNHTATCWTTPSSAQLPAPTLFSELDRRTEFLDISAGENHMCGIQASGAIKCYGGCRSVPSVDAGYGSVSAGNGIACAVARAGTSTAPELGRIVCWSDLPSHPLLSGIPEGPFLDVSVGETHACGLRCNGTLACWGDQAGYRGLSQSASYSYISAGAGTTCGVVTEDTSTPSSPPVCSGGSMALAFDVPVTTFEVACGGFGCVAAATTPTDNVVIANTTLSAAMQQQQASNPIAFVATGPTGERPWRAVATSANGTRMLAAAAGDFLYLSTDGGATWVARGSSRVWAAAASSADGMRMIAAAASNDFLYLSADGGETWVARASSRNWAAVASSASGNRLFAVDGGGSLYRSLDGGESWTVPSVESLPASRAWTSVACSADGMRVLAAAYFDLYKSSDGGATWTRLAAGTSRSWSSVAGSANGMRWIAAVNGDRLFKSTDGGDTWVPALELVRGWTAVSSSADGTRLVAVYPGGTYTSTNGGVSWRLSEQQSDRFWKAVAFSADGLRIVAAVSAGQVFTSTGTWPPATPPFVSLSSAPSSLPAFNPRIVAYGGPKVPPGQVVVAPPTSSGALSLSLGSSMYLSRHVTSLSLENVTVSTGAFVGSCARIRVVEIKAGQKPLVVPRDAFEGLHRLEAVRISGASSLVFNVDALPTASRLALLDVSGSGSVTLVPAPPSRPVITGTYLALLLVSCGVTDVAPLLPALRQLSSNASRAVAIDLKLNAIDSLPQDAFTEGFDGLRTLDLTANNMRYPSDQAFSSVGNPLLESLYISRGNSLGMRCPPSLFNRDATFRNRAETTFSYPGCAVCPVGAFCPGDGLRRECPRGTFSNALAATSNATCSLCPAGTYNELTGQPRIGCVSCSPGFASPVEGSLSSGTCKRCSPGYFAANPGQPECTACSAGRWSSAVGAFSTTACVACGLGKWSSQVAATNETVCNTCPGDRSTLEPGATSESACTSTSCVPGKAQQPDGSCVDCEPGRFAALGSNTCSLCPLGFYTGQSGAAQCTACAAGWYGHTKGAKSFDEACLPCARGTVNTLEGQTRVACAPCAPGYASSTLNASLDSACGQCLPGYYAAVAGQVQCTACPAGRFSSAVAAPSDSVCQSCPRGFYGTQPAALGIASCLECRKGFTTALAGASSPDDCNVDERRACPAGQGFSPAAGACVLCPPGFTGTPGDLGCAPCPAGRYLPPSVRNATADACLLCPSSRYSALPNATSVAQCVECPFGFWPTAGASRCEGCAVGKVVLSASRDCVSCGGNSSVCNGGATAALPPAATVQRYVAEFVSRMRKDEPQGARQGRQLTSQPAAAAATQLLSADATGDNTASSLARYAAPAQSSQPLSPGLTSFVLSPAALVVGTTAAAAIPLLMMVALPSIRRFLNSLRSLDLFGTDRPLRDGESVHKFSSLLGVGVSFSYVFGMLGAALVLVLSWRASNAVYTSTLRPLLPGYGWGNISAPLEFTLGFAADDASACGSVQLVTGAGASSSPRGFTAYYLPGPPALVADTRAPALCAVRLLWKELVHSESGQLLNVTLLLHSSAQSISWSVSGLLTPSVAQVNLEEAAAVATGTLEPSSSSSSGSSFGLQAGRIRLSVMPLDEQDDITPREAHGLLVVACTTAVDERVSPEIVPGSSESSVRIELTAEPVQQYLLISVTERSSVAQLLASAVGLLSGLGVLFRMLYITAYAAAQKLYGGQPPWEQEALAARAARDKQTRPPRASRLLHPIATAVRSMSSHVGRWFAGRKGVIGSADHRRHGSRTGSVAGDLAVSSAEMHVINPVAAQKRVAPALVAPRPVPAPADLPSSSSSPSSSPLAVAGLPQASSALLALASTGSKRDAFAPSSVAAGLSRSRGGNNAKPDESAGANSDSASGASPLAPPAND